MAESPKKKILSESQVMRRNLLITFILMFILLMLYATIPGYNYAVKDVAFLNKERIDQIETRKLNFNLPEITWELKRQFRIEDYWFIQTIQDETPKNSNTVVLLPPHSAVDSTPEFNLLNSSEWMEYFLYPRLCVSEDEKDTKKELYARANYVAIVNNWGYDKLKYEPYSRPSEAVLSIEKPKVDSTKSADRSLKRMLWSDSTYAKPDKLNEQNQ